MSSVNSPYSFPRSQMFEGSTWSRVGCCAMSRDHCPQQQKQRVPQTWLCTDSQPMPVAGTRSPGSLPALVGPAEREVRKNPEFSHERVLFCLSFSLKEQLVSPCLTANVRQIICERMEQATCVVIFGDKPPGLSGWTTGWVTGPSAGRGIPAASLGILLGATLGVLNGFVRTSKYP